MAKQEQQSGEQKGLVSEESKAKIQAGLQDAGSEIREKLTEKAIEAIEKAIAKLEEVLAWLKPHPEPVVQDAALHIQTAIAKLKQRKEAK
jgi:paraquat-inducible protein B